jgi:hypothetical protein
LLDNVARDEENRSARRGSDQLEVTYRQSCTYLELPLLSSMRSACDASLSRLRADFWRSTPETTPITGWPSLARRDPAPIREVLERYEPPVGSATTSPLCDVVRRMTKTLLPLHEDWDRDPELGIRGCRPFASAVKTLRSAGV